MSFAIHDLGLGEGRLGICRMPGRDGDYAADFSVVLGWAPDLVLTMTEQHELDRYGAADFGADLAEQGITWRHLPISDFGAPPVTVRDLWPEVSDRTHRVLADGGRVLAHCHGGCGRSGMVLLRLMIEAGEHPDWALARLRAVRPCAVETDGQFAWAALAAR